MDPYYSPPSQAKKSSKPVVVYLLSGIVIILLAALGYFVYRDYFVPKKPIKDTEVAIKQEIDTLVTKVGRHITLPPGEVPTLATVANIDQLKTQPFFKNAKNGDKILVYTKAKKAILYRPSTDRIIEVGPVDLSKNDSQPAPSIVPTIAASPSAAPLLKRNIALPTTGPITPTPPNPTAGQ